MDRISVLFICTANAARSQMAEALLKRHAGDVLDVYSAGLRPKEIHPLTTQVLGEIGIDISECHAKPLSQFLGKMRVSHAIFVCEKIEADCPTVYPFSLHQHFWPFPDPTMASGTEEERLSTFRSVRDQIDERLLNWLDQQGIPHQP